MNSNQFIVDILNRLKAVIVCHYVKVLPSLHSIYFLLKNREKKK